MALMFNDLVFDDMVYGTTTVYTPAIWNAQLGMADRLSLHAIVTQSSGTTPTLTVAIEMSGDGRNWGAKNGTPEINNQSLTAATLNQFVGADSNAAGSMGLVRLKITLGGTTPQAYVRIFATGREGF